MVVTSVSATRALLTLTSISPCCWSGCWYAQEKLKNGPAEQASNQKGEWRAHTRAITKTWSTYGWNWNGWSWTRITYSRPATGRGPCAAATCLLLINGKVATVTVNRREEIKISYTYCDCYSCFWLTVSGSVWKYA